MRFHSLAAPETFHRLSGLGSIFDKY